MHIRLALASEIYQLAILDDQVNSTPWNMGQYQECLANPNNRVYVLEIDQVICGLLVLLLIKDEVDILQLAIARKCQNKKLGAFLLSEALLELSAINPISKAFLEVCINNTAALALYKNLGFTQISIRKNYYLIKGQRYDALIMMLNYAKS